MTTPTPTPQLRPDSPFLTDGKGDPIFEDSHLMASRWWPPHYTSATCFLWHVECSKTGKRMLVADAEKKRVLLTEARAQELVTYTPSPLINLADYPEEWAWWRASGWGLVVQAYNFKALPAQGLPASKAIAIQAERRNASVSLLIRDNSPELAAAKDPAWVRARLIALLYYCLHPRKAACTEEGVELPADVAADFVREQRAKMRRLGLS